MTCPKCGGGSFERSKATRVNREGVVLRMKHCLTPQCSHKFITAELVVVDEFEPVARLDRVLRTFMDESDARAKAEIDGAGSLEGLYE